MNERDRNNARPVPDVRAAEGAAGGEAELARLLLLQDALQPVLERLSDDVDVYDPGVVPGDRPRLSIDATAFVEMARDGRFYRFVQEVGHGRSVLAESERLFVLVDAVAGHVARRHVERRAMAAAGASRSAAETPGRPPQHDPALPSGPACPPWTRAASRLVVEHLGIVALCVLFWFVGRWLYQQWLGVAP